MDPVGTSTIGQPTSPVVPHKTLLETKGAQSAEVLNHQQIAKYTKPTIKPAISQTKYTMKAVA